MKNGVTAAALCLGLLAAVAEARAQPAPPEAGAAPATQVELTSGIRGRVLLEGVPAPGTRVLVYPSTQGSPMGPGFLSAVLTDGEGRFNLGIAPGSYKVGARRRAGQDTPGLLTKGDYRATVQPEIVVVTEGSWTDLGDLKLRPIDPAKLAEVVSRGFQEQTATAVEGRVTGADGSPLPGHFVLAYRSPEMTGKPEAVTETRADGTFTLYLPAGGAYSLRARAIAGGSVQPGEPIGVVAGSADSRLEIPVGETLRGVELVVGGGR
jgi:hypothetical protein